MEVFIFTIRFLIGLEELDRSTVKNNYIILDLGCRLFYGYNFIKKFGNSSVNL